MTTEPEMDVGALCRKMGIELVEARPGRVVALMPVEDNTQPFGLLHGGASAVLAESVGSVAAWLHGGPESTPVGLDLSCTYHRAVRTGTVTAVATPLAEGRTVASYDIRITDEEGRPVTTARLTCLLNGLRGPGAPANTS